MPNTLKIALWSGLSAGIGLIVLAAPALAVSAPATSALAAGPMIDTDQDGLTDYDEVRVYHTDPSIADTDGDGFADGDEASQGFPHGTARVCAW